MESGDFVPEYAMILSRARARARVCVCVCVCVRMHVCPFLIHGRKRGAMDLIFHNFMVYSTSNYQAINFLLHLLFVVNGEKQKKLEKD